MAYSLLRRPDQRTEAEQRQLLQVQQADLCLTTLATYTEAFVQMVRERAAERLEPWLEGVLTSPWRELKRFAQGLRQDYAAVQAALTSPYSNGPTEGHVNRLKLFKRQMYGRAKLDLDIGSHSNAGTHLLPEAAARNERRLEAVRWSARLCEKSLF
jgi:transposase